jgi:hypothetical protein
MNRSSLALVSLLALSAPALGVDTPAVSQWLVTSAMVTGKNGELFVTSLRLVNDTPTAATVDLLFYPAIKLSGNAAPGDNTVAGRSQTVTIPAGQTLAIEDVLNTQFGVTSGSGGLRIESTNGVPISVLSQTLVTNAKAADGTPGTYGFAIPAQLLDNAIALGDTGYVPYLSSPVADRLGYRSNLFLQSASDAGDTVVTVRLVKGMDGNTIGTPQDVTLGKLVQTQINGIAGFFGYTDANTNLMAVITVKSGGPVFVGASVNDNATGSQVYAPPTKKWYPDNSAFGVVIDDGGFGFAGRLDIINGQLDFFSFIAIMDNCPGSTDGQFFFFEVFPSGPNKNSDVTKNADGSFSITGVWPLNPPSQASFSGTVFVNIDGSVGGTMTYTRALGAAGGTCPGATKDFPFFGARVAPLNP